MNAIDVAIEPPRSAALTAEVVSDERAFGRLQAAWNAAVSRARIPHPFLRHEWIQTWWECFGAGRQLHIVIVRRGAEIVGIAPMMLERAIVCGVPVRRLDLIHNDHTPRADLVIAGDADVYGAIWRTLREETGEWDVLQLSRVLRNSPTLETVASLAHRDGFRTGTWRGDTSPYLELAGSFEEYKSSLSAKFRSNLRNRRSRLTRVGEVTLETVGRGADIGRACDDALRLEASGWKDTAGTAIRSAPGLCRFYTAFAHRAADHGYLRLLFLTVGSERIAAAYAASFDRRLLLVKTGYAPAFAACAPFKLLTYLAVEAAYGEGLRELDFLGDDEPWKREWTTTSRAHDWLFVFSNTVRARLLHSLKFQVLPELKRWRA